MTNEEFDAALEKAIASESENEWEWYWLSFAEDCFLGAVIICAPGFLTAVQMTHALGINPGGQVASWTIPPNLIPAEEFRGRLLSKEDVTRIYPDAKSLRELDEEGVSY